MIALSTFEPKRPSMTPGEAPRRSSRILKCCDILARAEPQRRIDSAFDDVGRSRRWSLGDFRRAGLSSGSRSISPGAGSRAMISGSSGNARRALDTRSMPSGSLRANSPGSRRPARARHDAGIAQLLAAQALHILGIVEIIALLALPRMAFAHRLRGARRRSARLGPLDGQHLARIGIDDHAPAELVSNRSRQSPYWAELDAFDGLAQLAPGTRVSPLTSRTDAWAPNDESPCQRRKHDYAAQRSQTSLRPSSAAA